MSGLKARSVSIDGMSPAEYYAATESTPEPKITKTKVRAWLKEIRHAVRDGEKAVTADDFAYLIEVCNDFDGISAQIREFAEQKLETTE